MGILLCGSFSLAQEPDLRQVPPPIAFEPWRPVEADARTQEFEVVFPSALETPHPANNLVQLRAYLPTRRTGPVPCVAILHYWGALDWRVERNIAAELNARGIGAVAVALPYHLGRTPPGSRSGALAIQPEPAKLKLTMLQSVLDVRRALDWVAAQAVFDSTRIGIAGTSLGAIVAAILSSVDPRIQAAAYVLGGADIAHVLWHSSRVVNEREALRREGYTEERLRRELASIEPLRFLSERAPARTFVIGARHDTVIPSQATHRLIASLPDPAVLWLDTGHYGGFFVQKRVHDEVAKFFEQTFQGQTYVPPKRISAPTVRLGVTLYPERGLQVVAGLDIWRGDAAGRTFVNLQVAPRGPQVFLGRSWEQNLAVGIFVRSGSIRPGLFWSIVL
jgi:dienelactone hydrolase